MSHVNRKTFFLQSENKGTDQLQSNHAADQHLCFGNIGSTIPILSKSEISSLKPASVAVQLSLCQTWSEISEKRFSLEWLLYDQS